MNTLSVVLDVEQRGFTAMRDLDRANVVHLGNGTPLELGGLVGGMDSGAASVAFCCPLPDGKVLLAESSMALLSTATRMLEVSLGQPQPDSAVELLLAVLLRAAAGQGHVKIHFGPGDLSLEVDDGATCQSEIAPDLGQALAAVIERFGPIAEPAVRHCTCQPKPSGEAPDQPDIDCPVHGAGS